MSDTENQLRHDLNMAQKTNARLITGVNELLSRLESQQGATRIVAELRGDEEDKVIRLQKQLDEVIRQRDGANEKVANLYDRASKAENALARETSEKDQLEQAMRLLHANVSDRQEIINALMDGEKTLKARVQELELEQVNFNLVQGQTSTIIAFNSYSFELLRTANVARNKEWDPENKITLPFRSLELQGEVGELSEAVLGSMVSLSSHAGKIANQLKKIERKRLGLKGSPPNHKELLNEIGDVQITLDLLCMELGVDLWEATVATFNNTSDKLGFAVKL